jgi:hypothetical protein
MQPPAEAGSVPGMRQTLDYAPVRAMATATAERLLVLSPGTLAPVTEG